MIFLSGSIAFGFPGVMTSYWQDQFHVGNAETGLIFGLIFTAYGLVGGIAGPALSGLILERTGQDYGIVFSYLGIMSVLAMILIIRIKKR